MNTDLATKLSQNKWFAYNTLIHVFRHLEMDDVLNAAKVCKMWNWVALDDSILRTQTFASCEIHLSSLANRFGANIRSLEVDGLARTSVRTVTRSLRKMPKLRKLVLADCRLQKVDQIMNILPPDLEFLQIEQTHREYPEMYCIDFVDKFPNLTYLGIMTFSRVSRQSLESIKSLKKLQHFYIYEGSEVFDFDILQSVRSLRVLHLGGNTSMYLNKGPEHIRNIFHNHIHLYKLKIEIYPDCDYTFFAGLQYIPNLTHLEINGEIITSDVGKTFCEALAQLRNIKVLTIEMDPELTGWNTVFHHAIRNTLLYTAVLQLKNTLQHFYWLVPSYYVKWVKKIYGKEDCMLFQKYTGTPENLIDIQVTRVRSFGNKLQRQMPNVKVFVLIQNYGMRYCPDCKLVKV